MPAYFQKDIKQFDDGELDLSSGDLAIATVQQSQRQLLINILSTTRGDHLGDPDTGWGCEQYVGRLNSPIVHQTMAQDIDLAFNLAQDIASEDLDFVVFKLSQHEAGITVRHNGLFLEADGTTPSNAIVLGWKLSYETGEIETVEDIA